MTARGKIILTILVLGVVGLGAWIWWGKMKSPGPGTPVAPSASTNAVSSGKETAPEIAELVPTRFEGPQLAPAATYIPKDNIVEIELSEYAGYAGLIVANGGLEPNENSYFFKTYGFKPKITLSESENWSPLNSGKIAGTASTTAVL